MELLLLLALVLLSCLAVLLRRSKTGRAPAAFHDQQQVIEIGDPVVAHRALIDNAEAFSNRPASLFPVALVTGPGRRRSDNLTSVPYGPLWRVLRCNLTAEILHPSRLGLLAPLQKAALEALVADLSARAAAGGGGGVVVVRDSLYPAMFALVARLCFGDGLEERHVLALQRVLQEFVLAVGEAKVDLAAGGSRLARSIMHWRRRRRFLAFRGKQAELFLPLIMARRQSRLRSDADGGGFRSYTDSLLDLRVPNDDYAADDDDSNGRADDAGRRELTDDEMVSLVSEFLGAGTETVVSCVEWTLAHVVAAEPEVQNKLRREVGNGGGDKGGDKTAAASLRRDMPYLRAVVLESLRMHPPVPFLMRDVIVHDHGTVVLQATPTPAGGSSSSMRMRVHFVAGEIGRDKTSWVDPDEFRPERFLAGGEAEDVGPLPGPKETMRMLPFGAGRRYCPGMGLGMLHVKLFLATLVREFEWAPPLLSPEPKEDDHGDIDLTELNGFFKVMKKPLRARVRTSPIATSISSSVITSKLVYY